MPFRELQTPQMHLDIPQHVFVLGWHQLRCMVLCTGMDVCMGWANGMEEWERMEA